MNFILVTSCTSTKTNIYLSKYKIHFVGKISYYDTSLKRTIPVSLSTIEADIYGTVSNPNDLGSFKLTVPYPLIKKRAELIISANGFTSKKYRLNSFSKHKRDSVIDLGTIILNYRSD